MPPKQDLGFAHAVNMQAKAIHGVYAFTQTIAGFTQSADASGSLAVHPILSLLKTRIGVTGDQTLTDANGVFVTEKETIDEIASDGDYWLDCTTGRYVVKAGATASAALTYYVDVSVFRISGPTGTMLDVLVQNGAFGAAAAGLAFFGRYQATPTTYDDGDAVPVLLDAQGRIVLASDIEIGAVEGKDGDTDNRWNIKAANTARTTGTMVLAVQLIDATGKVPPAGDTAGNAPYSMITDGVNKGAVDPANTARTTGTVVQTVQHVDAAGVPLSSTLLNIAGLRVIYEDEVTVTTAGTPVACTSHTDVKAVRVINNNTDGTIIAVGKQATVDAVATPPIGVVLTAYSSVRAFISVNSNEIYVDSSANAKKVTVQYLGV